MMSMSAIVDFFTEKNMALSQVFACLFFEELSKVIIPGKIGVFTLT
jgi:hypothetical protein